MLTEVWGIRGKVGYFNALMRHCLDPYVMMGPYLPWCCPSFDCPPSVSAHSPTLSCWGKVLA